MYSLYFETEGENDEVVDERLWDPDEDPELKPSADDLVERDAEVKPEDGGQLEAKDEVRKPSNAPRPTTPHAHILRAHTPYPPLLHLPHPYPLHLMPLPNM